MPLVVVDASAVAAVVFGEAAAERIVERLEGRQLAAPSLLPYEIISVAGRKLRRGVVSARTAVVALRTFLGMRITLHEPDSLRVFQLASHTGLTGYDAAYLSLASSLSTELVTLDAKLERAAATIRP
jgi:predicted nucleic acid-binding protein